MKFVYFVLRHLGWGRVWTWVYDPPMTFTILSGRWVGDTGCTAKSSTEGLGVPQNRRRKVVTLMHIYRVIQSSSTILKEVVGRTFGAEDVNNVFFHIRYRFRVTTFFRRCRFVLLWSFDGESVVIVRGSTVDDALRRVFRWMEDTADICCDYVLYSTISALTSPHHTNRKVHWNDWKMLKKKKGRIFFLSLFHCLQGH
jgi:hypothetical protein